MQPVRSRSVRRATGALSALFAGLVLSCGTLDPTKLTDTPPPGQNTAPVAQAGPDVTVNATVPVALDGSGSSDGDGDNLTYEWSFTSVPTGSQAAFDDATVAMPVFTPDLPGAYVVELVVNDGQADSPPDELTVTARDPPAAPFQKFSLWLAEGFGKLNQGTWAAIGKDDAVVFHEDGNHEVNFTNLATSTFAVAGSWFGGAPERQRGDSQLQRRDRVGYGRQLPLGGSVATSRRFRR